MATTLKTKNSVTTTVVPTTLAQGELAVNITDKKMWVGNAATTPVQILGAGATNRAGGSNTQVQYNSSGDLAGSANMTFDGSNLSVAGFLNVGGSGGANTLNLFGATGVGMRVSNTTTGNSYYLTSESGDKISSNVAGSGYYTWTTGGTEKLRLDTSGNLGIGVTPTQKLDVNGIGLFRGSGGEGGEIQLYNAANNAIASVIDVDSGNNLRLNNGLATNVTILTNSVSRLNVSGTGVVTTSGIVGINGAATASDYALSITGSSGVNGGLVVFDSTSAYSTTLIQNTTAGYLGTRGSYPLVLQTNNTERMRIDSSGNVGIGTSSPTSLGSTVKTLELTSGSSAGGGGYYLSSNGTTTTQLGTDGVTGYIGTRSNHPLAFTTNNTERMRITAGGDLLLGTTSNLGARFAVYGTSGSTNNYIQITNPGYGTGTIGVNGTSPNFKIYNSYSSGTLSGGAGIDITTTGNVGINTTTTGAKLDVRGTSGTSTLHVYAGGAATTANIFPATGYRSLSCENGNTGETTDGMVYCFNATAGSTSWAYFGAQSAVSGVVYKVYGNGNVVNLNNSYGSISDIKLKENIVDATPKLEQLCQLKVRNFNFIKTPEQKQLGLIAQEVEQIFPSMIEESPDRDENGQIIEGEFTKNIKYSVFVPMLLKAIQELNEKVTALEAQLQGK